MSKDTFNITANQTINQQEAVNRLKLFLVCRLFQSFLDELVNEFSLQDDDSFMRPLCQSVDGRDAFLNMLCLAIDIERRALESPTWKQWTWNWEEIDDLEDSMEFCRFAGVLNDENPRELFVDTRWDEIWYEVFEVVAGTFRAPASLAMSLPDAEID